MKITESDFVMEPVSDDSNRFNLWFYKKVKKKETGKFEQELGTPLYGLTLSNCLNKIVHYRTAKKFQEENVSLKTFLKEFQSNYRELVKLCKESIPEKFDTGE